MFKYHILLQFCIHIIENVQNISQHISCLIFKTITYCRLFLKWISVLNWLAIIHFALKIQKKYRILRKTFIFFLRKLVFFSTSWKKSLYFYQLRHSRTSNFFFLQNDSHFSETQISYILLQQDTKFRSFCFCTMMSQTEGIFFLLGCTWNFFSTISWTSFENGE